MFSGLQVGELEEFGNEVRVLRALADTAVYHPGEWTILSERLSAIDERLPLLIFATCGCRSSQIFWSEQNCWGKRPSIIYGYGVVLHAS